MTTIHKDKLEGRKSPWVVRWTNAKGKRKSKFFPTKEKRDTFAAELDKQLDENGNSVLDIDWSHYQEYLQLKKLAGDSIDLIEVLRYALARHVDLERKSAKEVFDLYEEHTRATGVTEDYMRHLTLVLNRFNDYYPDVLIREITTEQVSTWIASFNFVAETRVHYRKHLLAAFEYAKDRNWLTENVVKHVPKPKVIRAEPEFYSVEEVRKLLEVARDKDPALLVPFALGLFGGLRPSSALRICADEVRLADQNVVIPAQKAKGGKRLVLQHFPETLWAWLKIAPESGYGIKKRDYEERKKRIFLRADIESRKNGFRHSFASYHVAWKGDIGLTATILGHRGSLRILEDHYRAQVEKAAGEAYFKIFPKA